MPDDPDTTEFTLMLRDKAVSIALSIAEINHVAEVQKILADAKRILSFYEKGPVE
jgi:hypothetical protein